MARGQKGEELENLLNPLRESLIVGEGNIRESGYQKNYGERPRERRPSMWLARFPTKTFNKGFHLHSSCDTAKRSPSGVSGWASINSQISLRAA